MNMAEFTVAEGIKIQSEHLYQWKSVLKPEVYTKLEQWATATNVMAGNGDDIRRGNSLDEYVHNHLMVKQ